MSGCAISSLLFLDSKGKPVLFRDYRCGLVDTRLLLLCIRQTQPLIDRVLQGRHLPQGC
jgi:hypothetical protein